MRQSSNVENEIWGNKREVLTYLKEVKALMKKNQQEKGFEELSE